MSVSASPRDVNEIIQKDCVSPKTYTSADDMIKIEFNADRIDLSTCQVNVEIHASNATCTLPSTCGIASVFSRAVFNLGGADVTVINRFGDVMAAELLARETFASKTGLGISRIYGQAAALGNGIGEKHTYTLPLYFAPFSEGIRLNMAQFKQPAYIELYLAQDDVALYDTAGSGTYSITRAWISYHRYKKGEGLRLSPGDTINVTGVTSTTKTVQISDSIPFPRVVSNAHSITVLMNVDVSGYDATSDHKFGSNIAAMTKAHVTLNGNDHPRNHLGQRDFQYEAYRLAYDNQYPDGDIMKGEFIDQAAFQSGWSGMLTIPLRSLEAPRMREGLGMTLMGTMMSSEDRFVYEQSATSGANVILIVKYGQIWVYNDGGSISDYHAGSRFRQTTFSEPNY